MSVFHLLVVFRCFVGNLARNWEDLVGISAGWVLGFHYCLD